MDENKETNNNIIIFPKNNPSLEKYKIICENNLVHFPKIMADNNIININQKEIDFVSNEIKNNPNDSFLYFARAFFYCLNDNLAIALPDLKKSISLNDKNADAYHLYGDIKYIFGSFQEALWAYDRAINLSDKNDEYLMLMLKSRADSKINLGLYKDAINDYNILIKHDKNNINFYEDRAMCYRLLKQYKEALDDYNKILEANGKIDMPSIIIRRAEMKYQLDLFDEAISDCNCALNIDNTNWKAYYRRALCKKDTGKIKEAISDFDIAIQLNNTYSFSYFLKGDCKRILSKYKEAIADFDKAIELNSKEWIIYFYRAKCKAELKNYKEAIKDFDKAIEIDDKSDILYICRSQCLAEINQYKEALDDCNRAIQINDQDSYYYFVRCAIKYELEELEEFSDIEGMKNDIDIALSKDNIFLFHVVNFLLNIHQKKFISGIKDLFKGIWTFFHFESWLSYWSSHEDVII